MPHLAPHRIIDPESRADLRGFRDVVTFVPVDVDPADTGRPDDVLLERTIDKHGSRHLYTRIHQVIRDRAAIGVTNKHIIGTDVGLE